MVLHASAKLKTKPTTLVLQAQLLSELESEPNVLQIEDGLDTEDGIEEAHPVQPMPKPKVCGSDVLDQKSHGESERRSGG